VRIEDLDPPREQANAANRILQSLESHGLAWDHEVSYQSKRSEAYLEALDDLAAKGLSYRCTCSRKRLSTLHHTYDGYCRNIRHSESSRASIRLNIEAARKQPHSICVADRLQNSFTDQLCDDFIIHRKDGLFAYQLAVVVDDIAQGVSHIVRGIDLFEATGKQMLMTDILRGSVADYAHIPILTDINGLKLSKQNQSEAIDDQSPHINLVRALRYLQQSPPEELNHSTVQDIIQWGTTHWNINSLKGITQVTADTSA